MSTFAGTHGDGSDARRAKSNAACVTSDERNSGEGGEGSHCRAHKQQFQCAVAKFCWNVALAFVLCLMVREGRADERPTFPDFTANTIVLLPYQSPGSKFLFIPLDVEPPSGFEQPAFDEMGFGNGTGAFGSGEECRLQSTVETGWPVNTQLLVRRRISIPAGVENARVMVSVDNDILGVFVNGVAVADTITHDECPILDEFRIDLPSELIQLGENLVAFHAWIAVTKAFLILES